MHLAPPFVRQVKASAKAETPGSALRGGRERGGPVVKVIQLPRANNISIMLTQVGRSVGCGCACRGGCVGILVGCQEGALREGGAF